MPVRSAAVALALAAALAACAPADPDWTAPGVGPVETEAAWANCQRLARQRADYGGGAIGDPTGGIATPGGGAATGTQAGGRMQDPMEVYDRQTAGAVYARTMNACMRAKGFYPKED